MAELAGPEGHPAAELAGPGRDPAAGASGPGRDPAAGVSGPGRDPAAEVSGPGRNPAAGVSGPEGHPAAELAGPGRDPAAEVSGPGRNPAAGVSGPGRNPAAEVSGPRREPAGEVSGPGRRPAAGQPLLEARGVTKHYGRVLALDGAEFTVYPGEVVALIGDNGAGKSTLVKTLSGTIRPDSGEILIEGKPVRLASPLDARRHGIETVYQDLALAPDLDAAANLHLGRELYLIPFLRVLNRAAMRERAVAAFGELGVSLPDVTAPVATLSGGQRRAVREQGHIHGRAHGRARRRAARAGARHDPPSP